MVAESYFTNQRLKFINDTVNDFHSEVMLLDPKRVNFVPLQQNLSRLGQEVSSQKRHIDYAAEDSIKWKHGAYNTLNDMNILEEDVIREIVLVNFIVSEVQSLASNIELRPGGKIENTVRKAEEILQKIKEVSFVNFRDKAIDQADQANILVSEMLQYNSPVNNLTSMASNLHDKIQNISTKMDDLLEITGKAEALAADVEDLNEDNRIAAESGNFDIVKNITLEAEEDLKAGEQLNRNASRLLDETNTNINILGKIHFTLILLIFVKYYIVNRISIHERIYISTESNTLQQVVMRLNDTILQNDQMLNNLGDSLHRAHDHAESLYSHSLELDNLLTDTRNTNAVRAVSAYRDIEMAIQVANYAALDAVYAANNATASVSYQYIHYFYFPLL